MVLKDGSDHIETMSTVMLLERNSSHQRYITVLVVMSALAVCILHANGVFWTFSYERYWLTANVIECVFYFAVPIFFMVSGATLIDYRDRYSTREFFRRRAVRAIFPFIVWSIIYSIWYFARGGVLPSSVFDYINSLFSNRYNSLFWFFPPLFGTYLAIPLLSLIPKDDRRLWFAYAIILRILFSSALPLLGVFGFAWPSAYELPWATGYTVYLLIGYWLANYNLSKRQAHITYAAGVIGLAIHIFGTWYLSYSAGEIVSTFKGYLNLPCILYSAAIFLAARRAEGSSALEHLLRVTAPFSRYTLGAYLLQKFALDLASYSSVINLQSIWYRTLGGVCIFLLCCSITWLLMRVPIVCKLMG